MLLAWRVDHAAATPLISANCCSFGPVVTLSHTYSIPVASAIVANSEDAVPPREHVGARESGWPVHEPQYHMCPLAILVVGTPIALLVRLVLEIGPRG